MFDGLSEFYPAKSTHMNLGGNRRTEGAILPKGSNVFDLDPRRGMGTGKQAASETEVLSGCFL